MADPASANEPKAEHVIEAVQAIEALDADLLNLKMSYMAQCKNVRRSKADEFESASNRGISRKLLKLKIKERDLQRKIEGGVADLEEDERSEYQMLTEKLGDFASTPLGAAAMAKADGKGTQTQMGL